MKRETKMKPNVIISLAFVCGVCKTKDKIIELEIVMLKRKGLTSFSMIIFIMIIIFH